MKDNVLTYSNVKLANLKMKVAKNGNEFVAGTVLVYDSNDKFEHSESFSSFDLVEQLKSYIKEGVSAAEAKAARPQGKVEFWLQTKSSKTPDDKWQRIFHLVSFTSK